jgi:hypothetical protein
MRLLAMFALAFGFAAAATAAEKELLLTPDQCKLVYSDLLSSPMKDLLASISPEDRRKFLAQHPGVDRLVGWAEPAAPAPAPAAAVISEQEQAAKDKELAKEAAVHIRPAGPADPASTSALTPAPAPAPAAAVENPPPSPAMPGFEVPSSQQTHAAPKKADQEMESLDNSFNDDD